MFRTHYNQSMTLRSESRCSEMIKNEMQGTCHPKAAMSISASHKNPCREEINASKWKKIQLPIFNL